MARFRHSRLDLESRSELRLIWSGRDSRLRGNDGRGAGMTAKRLKRGNDERGGYASGSARWMRSKPLDHAVGAEVGLGGFVQAEQVAVDVGIVLAAVGDWS